MSWAVFRNRILRLKLAAQRNKTETCRGGRPKRFVLVETKQFQYCVETVLFQFHFVVRTVLSSMCDIRMCANFLSKQAYRAGSEGCVPVYH